MSAKEIADALRQYQDAVKRRDATQWSKWGVADSKGPAETVAADTIRDMEGKAEEPPAPKPAPEPADTRIHIATTACGRGALASLDHEEDIVVCPCLTAATEDRHVVYVKGADPVHMCPKHYAIFLQLWQIHLLETSLKERGVKNLLTV